MYIPTHFMHLFEIGGIAEKALVEAGIKGFWEAPYNFFWFIFLI